MTVTTTQVRFHSATAATSSPSVSAVAKSTSSQRPTVNTTPSPQATRLVQQLSQASNVSPVAKETLIDMAALVDNFINNPSARNKAYKQLSGAGIYLGGTSDEGFPKYTELTGLRFYSGIRLHLAATGQPVPELEVAVKPPTMPTPEDFERAAAARVEQVVNNLLQAEAGVDLPTAEVALQQMPQAPQQVAAVAKAADIVVEDVAPPTTKPTTVVEA